MKIKVSNSIPRIISEKPRKSIKLLSHLKREVGDEDFRSIQDEFNQSFESMGSDIKVLEGSFSKLKPIGSKSSNNHFSPTGAATACEDINLSKLRPVGSKSSNNHFHPTGTTTTCEDMNLSKLRPMGSKSNNNHFYPPETSTAYEDVSEIDENTNTEDEEAHNITFNYQEDVVKENKVSTQYMQQVAGFIKETKRMINTKSIKRAELVKKLRKYEKKMKDVQAALKDVDKIISFGKQVLHL